MMYLTVLYVTCTIYSLHPKVSASEIRVNLFGPKGEISSPNYPNHYPLNVTIVWTIRTEQRNRIIVQFVDFELEKVKRCIYDYVQVREDERTPWDSQRLRRYCGKSTPPDFITKGPKAQVRFRSDYYNFVAKGFKAFWIVVKGPIILPTRSTERSPRHTCSQSVKTIVVSRACKIRPSSVSVAQKSCSCKSDTTHLMLPKTKPEIFEERKNYSDCKTEKSSKIFHESEREDSIGHLLSAFTAILVLFLLTTMILVFFLWRRRRELRYLRMARCQDPGLYPVLEWSIYRRDGNNSQCKSDGRETYMRDKASQSLNRKTRYTSTEATLHCNPKSRNPSRTRHYRGFTPGSQEEKYLTMISGSPRPIAPSPPGSESDEDDDREEHDTSDVYISTEFSSPTHTNSSCGYADQYEV